MRLGVEWSQSPATVGSGTSSVTVTCRIYVQTRYPASDSSNTYSIGGSFSASGSVDINHTGNSQITLVRSVSRTVSPSFTGSTKSEVTASLSGVNAVPGTASLYHSFWTAQRPYLPAPDVSNVAVARVSDSQHTVSWRNNATATAPYEKIWVDRWDNVSGTWKNVATLGGSATSWTDRGTVANRRYRYRVIPYNSAGGNDGSHVYTGYIRTSPAAPSDVRAVKLSGGDIRVSWRNNATAQSGFEIWHAANGVWDAAPIAPAVASATAWTHQNPDPAATHTYRVRASAMETGQATLYSPYSASTNTVQLLAPPAAPTVQSGKPTYDAELPVVVQWQHNPVDTTEQTAFEIQLFVDGETWVSSGKLPGDQSSYDLGAFGLTNGNFYEFQMRTWGAHANPSPWTTPRLFSTSASPTVVINAPTTEAAVGTPTVEVVWGYFDPEGEPQSRWRATLYDADGDPLETRSAVGTADRTTFTTVLVDGRTYQVAVQVHDYRGMASEEARATFTVEFPTPELPSVGPVWDADPHSPTFGSVLVTVTNPPYAEGQVPTAYNQVWRRIDGGEWVLLADQVPENGTVTDNIPHLTGLNEYRVTAWSDLPSSADSEITPAYIRYVPGVGWDQGTFGEGGFGGTLATEGIPHDLEGWVFLNAGPGFARTVKVRGNAQLASRVSRAKVRRHFAGREYPVERRGQARSRTGTLSIDRLTTVALARGESTVDQIEELADLPAPICIRTPLGQRWFVGLDDVDTSFAGMREGLSVPFEMVDHRE